MVDVKGLKESVSEAAGAIAASLGIPVYLVWAIAIGIVVLVGLVAYLVFTGQIWFWLTVLAVGLAVYYGVASGYFLRVIQAMRENPTAYIPLALLPIGLGAYLFFASPAQPYADFVITLSYRVTSPPEGSLIAQLVGAAIDVNSIEANVISPSAYLGVPALHQPSFDPEPADRIGAGYYLEVSIGKKRYIFQLRNVSLLSRISGRTTERFFLYSIPLPADEPSFQMVLTIYENGSPIWSRAFDVVVR